MSTFRTLIRRLETRFKSEDGRQSWFRLPDPLQNYSSLVYKEEPFRPPLWNMTVDPTNSDILYLTTGRRSGQAWDIAPGLGILKSVNEGYTYEISSDGLPVFRDLSPEDNLL